MNRRDTIGALCTFAAIGGTGLGVAESAPRWRIGILYEAAKLPSGECPRNLRREFTVVGQLEKHDLIEGRDFVVERQCDDGHPERLSELAKGLVKAQVDVIVAQGSSATVAARGATDRTPIVMVIGPDPIAQGWAKSFGRPGGNLTGYTFEIDQTDSVLFKGWEFAREAIPNVRRIVQIEAPDHPSSRLYDAVRPQVAKRLGVEVVVVHIPHAKGVEETFRKIRELRPDVLSIVPNTFMVTHAKAIMEQVGKARLPVHVFGGEWVVTPFAGALIFTFPDVADAIPRAAESVAKILRGAKPADIPIERPTRTQTIVDLRVARQLGIRIPEAVLLRTTRIIE